MRISDRFLGANDRVVDLLTMAHRVAATDAPVLLIGESGTGKEVLAREIYCNSTRQQNPFLAVNCGAIANGLEDSELFGHERGAFTGAVKTRTGTFEAVDRGTIFLDEIAETSASFQVKLLRILQNGEYSPVGTSESRRCDVRVIAATNQDLMTLVHDRRFRPDLYYRLNVVRLDIPPLRERKDDILLLARHFLRRASKDMKVPLGRMTPDFERALLAHDYPGNVRELFNIIQRAVIFAQGEALTTDHLPPELLSAAARSQASDALQNFHEAKRRVVEQFEREYLIAVISQCHGIISRAALRCGLSERNLHGKLKAYGIDGKRFREPMHADADDAASH